MSAAKGLLGTFSEFVTAPFKFAGKLLNKGFMGRIFNALKPLGKIFKRIPFIGTFISIGFAISRFNKGQNVRGVIDVLSGLVGLIDLVAPGVGFTLSLGLDMLNVWMDSKMSDPANKGKSEMDILGEIGKTIGNWIWKNADYLPVIGSFKRWGMAYDAFKGGNIMEGLKQFGLGIVSLIPGGGPLIMGIQTLMGFFGDKEEKKDLKPSTSWFGRIKEWVKNKLKKLPSFLRKPLEWFGIIDDSSESEPNMGSSQKINGDQKLIEWFSGLWDKITPMLDNIGKWFSGLWDKISNWASGLWEKMTPFFEDIAKWFSDIWKKVKEFLGSDFMTSIIDSIKNIASSVMSIVDTIFGTIKSIVEGALVAVTGFSKLFGGGDKEAEENAKKMGWNSVEEYEKSGWKENPNKKKVEIVDEKRKQHVDDLVLIGREQIAILTDIRNIGMQTYKVLSNGSGGSASPIIISNSGGGSKSKPSSQVSLNTSRGDYASSPYAFA
jgi:hypothetical protein